MITTNIYEMFTNVLSTVQSQRFQTLWVHGAYVGFHVEPAFDQSDHKNPALKRQGFTKRNAHNQMLKLRITWASHSSCIWQMSSAAASFESLT